MKQTLLALAILAVSSHLFAQTSQERQILVTPRAEHPQTAKDSGLGGRVTVYVTVDHAGNVTSVGDANGPDNVCSSVTRPDVLALREAARTAAISAKFAAGDAPSTIPLNFEFPSGPSIPLREGEYSGPVNIAPKAEARTSPTGLITSVSGQAHEMKSERVYTAQNTPPPDYTGPAISAAGSSGTPTSKAGIPGQISGGVLNGKAISLPRPPYPAAARAVRASGAVNIQVLIDEEGHIFSAAAVSGHPLLRSAARQAACGAAFSPTLLMGNPVKVSGIITYNFVP